MENKRTLKYYQIGNNNLIILVLINKKDSLNKKGTELEKNNNINMEKKRKINENDKIHINVETISGKKIDLDITEDYEIKQIKNIIQEKEGIDVEQQMIFFEGFELDDRKSLKYYKIHDEFILYLLLKRNKDNKENNKIQMLIKSMDGRKLNLEVDSKTIIKEIKYKIQDKEGIPFSKQRLIFSGIPLDDNKKLSDYTSNDEIILHLIIMQTDFSVSNINRDMKIFSNKDEKQNIIDNQKTNIDEINKTYNNAINEINNENNSSSINVINEINTEGNNNKFSKIFKSSIA